MTDSNNEFAAATTFPHQPANGTLTSVIAEEVAINIQWRVKLSIPVIILVPYHHLLVQLRSDKSMVAPFLQDWMDNEPVAGVVQTSIFTNKPAASVAAKTSSTAMTVVCD